MLYETLNKLPENYRTVFIKSFFEGKTHTEIAEEMNLSVKSINRYKQKTMELLRNELKEYMPLLLLLFLRA
jgi:RNA polymerase sigma-70 factor